jgi:hypothetical protein
MTQVLSSSKKIVFPFNLSIFCLASYMLKLQPTVCVFFSVYILVSRRNNFTVPLLWCSVNVVLASFRLNGEEEGDEVILQLLQQGQT